MSELRDAGRMIEAAEQAAIGEDFTVADELLRAAARIQEAELGPLHPDLANTLNNRAIVAERAGRLADAETLYRRAVAIASASLPANHPMIADSRENLEQFCRAHGLPIDLPAFLTPLSPDTAVGLDAFDREHAAAGLAETPTDVAAGGIGFTPAALRPPSDLPSPVPVQPTTTVAAPLPAAPRLSHFVAWSAISVVIVFGITTFLVSRPWWSRDTSTPAPATATPAPPPAAEPAPPPRATPPAQPAAIERTRTPPVVSRGGRRGVADNKPPASSPAAGAISLATAQLCRTLSTSGANWRCDQPADPTSRGPIMLYTRVRSPRDAVVVHRWYRRDALRQSVKLPVRASATEGYRTFSRQTVDAGEWRVEVSSATGDVLYERRFTVR